MFVYLLSEVCFFFVCYLPAPPDTASPRVPGRTKFQRSWDALEGPALPEGGRVRVAPGRGMGCGASARWRAGCWTGALSSPAGSRPLRVPCRAVFFSSPTAFPIRAHHQSRRDPFHIHQDGNPRAVPEPPVGTSASS